MEHQDLSPLKELRNSGGTPFGHMTGVAISPSGSQLRSGYELVTTPSGALERMT